MQATIDERLVVTPLLSTEQIGPASIDLRLGSEFRLTRRTGGPGLDPAGDAHAALVELQERLSIPLGEAFWLHPRQFILGATLEFLRLPSHLTAYVLGRSSWGRVGLIVATAIMVQPGYTGTLTLELVNEGDSPIKLYPGLRIAQLAVHQLSGATAWAYDHPVAKYLAPTGPEVSRLAWDAEEIKKVQRLGDGLRAR